MNRLPALLAAAALVAACGGESTTEPPAPPAPRDVPVAPAPDAPRFHFVDATERSGVTAVTWCGRPEKPHLLESNGNGVALFDYDADGDLDLYLPSGWRLEGEEVVERARSTLWENRGDGTFEDVTDAAGVANGGWATGIAVGDFDGDARPDLFVMNCGADVLYRNEGGGKFSVVPNGPGIDGWSAAAAFFDADGDGDEDLYVAGYVDCTLDDVLRAKPTLDWKGAKVMLGPFGLKGKADEFFRNDGGKFVRATEEAGLRDVGDYYGFGVAATDLDVDGDLDLYVANDSNPQYVYKNDGKGKFTESGLWCGAALTHSGASQAGMGIGIGDYDADGLPDILLSTFADDTATLYRNLGKGLFRDESAKAGLRDPTFKPLKWGTVFADFDLDGDEDAYIATGHIYPQADTAPESDTRFAQRDILLENAGASFREVSAQAGPGLAVEKVSHGVAKGDLDGDGDLDLVISNVDATPTILVNESPRQGGWLLVDAPGALRVTAEAGGRSHTAHFVANGSFASESDRRFHFGVPPAASIVRLRVVWQRGGETVVETPPNRAVRVRR